MKLLGWMHRKSRQNNNESPKNFTIGNPSTCFAGKLFLDEKKYYVEPSDTFSASWQPNKMGTVLQDESSEPFSFLAIGTFGAELMDTDPPTPTFPMPSQKTNHEQTETRENDPELMNYELEKFLDVEADDIGNDSSPRSSLASIVTICSKEIEGGDSRAFANIPPHDFLIASTEELFRKNRIVDDDPNGKREGSEKRAKGNYVTHFMKKMMKKIHSISKSNTAFSSGDATESSSITRKLPKGLKVFHKKVHPEGLITEKQFKLKKGMAKNIAHKHEGDNEIEENGKKKPPQTANIKQYGQNAMNRSSNLISKGVTRLVNGEHWIKTDAECK